jgi:hypothetical protein
LSSSKHNRNDKPRLRVLDAGGMARPGVGPRRDETPAVGVSGSGFGTGLASDAASSPDPEAVFVVCHELLGRLHRRAPRQTLLYVDVNGVALLDAKTARCVSRAGFNELTSWCAVDARVFELKQLGVETRKLELRRFETTSAVAAELAAAMRSRVRLYVERPDEVRRLRATAATFRAGDTVRRETLARAHALGGGEAAAAASRFAKQTPFAKKKVPGSADESRARRLVRAATPGERLARAGARRAALARDRSQPSEVPPPHGDDAAETASLSLSGDESESSGERFTTGSGFFQFGDANGNNSFADGAGLDDASLRAAYARREAAYFKLREEEDAAWAASREEREERETESDGERGIARETFSFAAKSPTEPPSDARSARGFHKRERARELERERARAAETIASPPPALFDATLANPRMEPEPAEDPEAWLGGADYFYDDFSDEGEDDDDGKGAEKERRPSSGLSGYDPVSVSPRSPGASARTPSNTRGGGRTDQTDKAIDEETKRLNRRVRGFAGLLRDSLTCVSRARTDADVRAECAVLVDRLRRFTAEGLAEEEGFAG